MFFQRHAHTHTHRRGKKGTCCTVFISNRIFLENSLVPHFYDLDSVIFFFFGLICRLIQLSISIHFCWVSAPTPSLLNCNPSSLASVRLLSIFQSSQFRLHRTRRKKNGRIVTWVAFRIEIYCAVVVVAVVGNVCFRSVVFLNWLLAFGEMCCLLLEFRHMVSFPNHIFACTFIHSLAHKYSVPIDREQQKKNNTNFGSGIKFLCPIKYGEMSCATTK